MNRQSEITNPKVSLVLPNTGALSHHGRSSLWGWENTKRKKEELIRQETGYYLSLHSHTVAPLWWHRKGCARNSRRVASSGLWLTAGSGRELVEVGGSERKDKATCVAASEILKKGKRNDAARFRVCATVWEECKKRERMNRGRGVWGGECLVIN